MFVAAVKPYKNKTKGQCINSLNLIHQQYSCQETNTHLNPLDNIYYILRLEQKLLPLHPNPYNILPLRIITPQPALRMLQRIQLNQVSRVWFRNGRRRHW